MTLEEILKELRAGRYRPVYLLMGDEPYPIDVVSNYIEKNALSEEERAFNQTVVYGSDTSADKIIPECKEYPSFASHRVVIIKEAQSLSKSDFDNLGKYVSKALDTTILVICYKYGNVDKRSKFYKAISEKKDCAVLETKKLYDNQMPQWIENFAVSQGFAIEQKAAFLLAEHLGTSQSDVAAAFEKFRTALGPDAKTITVDTVTEHTGVSNEYNSLELRNALFRKDREKVFRIIKVFGQNEKQHPVQPIFSTLYNSFDKLFAYTYTKATKKNDTEAIKAVMAMGERSEYAIKLTYEPASKLYSATKCMRIVNLLAQYDMRSKGYNYPTTTNRDLLVDVATQIMG